MIHIAPYSALQRLPGKAGLGCLILLFGLSSSGNGQGSPSTLECQISIEGTPTSGVDIECEATNPPATSIVLTGVRFPGQQLQGIDLVTPPLGNLQPELKSYSFQVSLPPGIDHWQIRYRLAGNLRRIPILVPDGSWESVVGVRVTMGGRKLAEPSFPPLTLNGDRLDGEFSHLPGFIFLPLVAAEDSIGFLSIQAWIDLSIVLLTLACSAYWLSLRKRARAELGESDQPESKEV